MLFRSHSVRHKQHQNVILKLKRGPRCQCDLKIHPSWVHKFHCHYVYPDSNKTNAQIADAHGWDEDFFRRLDEQMEAGPPPAKREKRDPALSTPGPQIVLPPPTSGASSSSSAPHCTWNQIVQAANQGLCGTNQPASSVWTLGPIPPNTLIMNTSGLVPSAPQPDRKSTRLNSSHT